MVSSFAAAKRIVSQSEAPNLVPALFVLVQLLGRRQVILLSGGHSNRVPFIEYELLEWLFGGAEQRRRDDRSICRVIINKSTVRSYDFNVINLA